MKCVITIAVKRLTTIPNSKISANPCIGPVPNWYRIIPVMTLVTCESIIAEKAFFISYLNGSFKRFSGFGFFPYPFIDKYVRINSHPERQD